MGAAIPWPAALLALATVACASAAGHPHSHAGTEEHRAAHHAARHQRSATVTVSGVGAASAVPDMAEISTGVVTQAPTAAQALAASSQAMEALLRSLESLGIAERDIQTTNVSVSPQRRQDRDGRPGDIVGYEVVNQVHVKVRDLALLGRVLDQQVAQGANSIQGIRFGLRDPVPLTDEARKRAIADARRRAELYATAAGLTLGRVLSVQEAGTVSPRPEPMGRVMMSAVPVAAGEQEIQVSVTVTYALER